MDLHNELIIIITIGWVDTSHLGELSVSFAKMRVNATTGMKIDYVLNVEPNLCWHVYAKGKKSTQLLILSLHFVHWYSL